MTEAITRALSEVALDPADPGVFLPILSERARAEFEDGLRRGREVFAGRTVWNVNSTARGGGVAEMLSDLLPYVRGAGVSTRWIVIHGDPAFFTVTKRIHNHLHGAPGDGGALDVEARRHYDSALEPVARDLLAMLRPRDIVILHDPQTAGLVPHVHERGIRVVWRCHVGVDHPNGLAHAAWRFLRDYVDAADLFIFSRAAFAWDGLDPERVSVIPPSINPFSAKNRDMTADEVDAVLVAAGLLDDGGSATAAEVIRPDGSRGRIERRATLREDARIERDLPLVVQVSRWDRLKDPAGVLQGFTDHVLPRRDAQLVLAGPDVERVSDDPEGLRVYREVEAAWQALPPERRRRVHLATLPMEDAAENATMVNALQRRADVVVQKSLAEGFGLTVAEAMWKSRPVVASRAGGIADQIEHGVSGLLLDDPADLRGFGDLVLRPLGDPVAAAEMGSAANARVCDHFIGSRHLMHYLESLSRLIDGEA